MLRRRLAEVLSLPGEAITSLKVLRRSLDARRSRPPYFVYALEVVLPEATPLPASAGEGISIHLPGEGPALVPLPPSGQGKFPARAEKKVVVVGSGPAGLFAALTLAEQGVAVLLLERGKPVPARCRDVRDFWDQGALQGESNVLFGEGGAGTFSDGKLTSRAKDPRIRQVKETLVALGAPAEIVTEAKPHIGTDRLRALVMNFRKKLLGLGCEVRFGARVSDFLLREQCLVGIVVNGVEEVGAECLVLAMGQHADDTYGKLRERGVHLEPKAFALGLRVEHPQGLINELQYGKWWPHPDLPPADYALTAATGQEGRSVYTFCMCPGGRIVGCSSEPGGVVTNGMSRSRRDGPYANSAVVVNVRIADFLGTPQEPLRGLAFRRNWEEKAFSLGGGDYCAPAQRLLDFLRDKESAQLLPTSFRPGVRSALLREALPTFVAEALKEGLRLFERKMPGFITEEAMLVGVETRTSAPVRILRDENGQSVSTAGLFPCGEGAGYAGGIISSALDGIRAAEKVLISLESRQ